METNSVNILKNNKIDRIAYQKALFIINALENGWTVKKRQDKYIFCKKNENRKEVYQEEYLKNFIESNINI